MKRQRWRTSEQADKVGKCCERLHQTAREIEVRERVDGRAVQLVADAAQTMLATQATSQGRTYRGFLYDISYHCGVSIVLLCAAGLGRKRIIELGARDRVSFLAYLKDARTSLHSPILDNLCKIHNLPSAKARAQPTELRTETDILSDASDEDAGCRPRKHGRLDDGSISGDSSTVGNRADVVRPLSESVHSVHDPRSFANTNKKDLDGCSGRKRTLHDRTAGQSRQNPGNR